MKNLLQMTPILILTQAVQQPFIWPQNVVGASYAYLINTLS